MNIFTSSLAAMGLCLTATLALAQTPTSVEAAEYEPNSDRWLVSNGSSILVTDDLGETWTAFGAGGATHGMEVLGSTLFAIQNNVIRAYDVVSGEQIGSLSPTGVTFLNGMGSESTSAGDLLVVSDFSSGRLLKVDVSDPTNMTYSTLVADTGTTPNGVTVLDGVATVVNWGGNSDILQVDVETGEMTVLVDGTGLGNCDGVDWANGSLIVSSWTPQRITQFSPDAENPGAWTATTLVNGSPLSNPADLSVNTLGDTYAVACSGNNTVYFGPLLDISALSPVHVPSADASLNGDGLALSSEEAGKWTVRGLDTAGRELGTNSLSSGPGQVPVSWDALGQWSAAAFLLEVSFEPTGSASGSWRTVLKHGATR
ncbi:MAG: hypothetical protein P8H88_06425 [Flavobacteriales bacterium]|nr:hypothetical protein [Flavobacteriales bacterium]